MEASARPGVLSRSAACTRSAVTCTGVGRAPSAGTAGPSEPCAFLRPDPWRFFALGGRRVSPWPACVCPCSSPLSRSSSRQSRITTSWSLSTDGHVWTSGGMASQVVILVVGHCASWRPVWSRGSAGVVPNRSSRALSPCKMALTQRSAQRS
eukprot:783048-Rhodomonas_salina.1